MKTIKNILVIDDEQQIQDSLSEPLRREGCQTYTAGCGQAGLEIINKYDIQLVFLDYNLPDINGLEVLARIKEISPVTIVVFITGQADVTLAVTAIKQGAYDFIAKPFRLATIQAILTKAAKEFQQRAEIEYLKKKIEETNYGLMVGKSSGMTRVYEIIEKVAKSPASTILVTGESGTGKELVAKCLHEKSNRAKNNFISINCSAIPEALLESELFGHEKGAFTDAKEAKNGLFELANGGTLFLDEIGDMPIGLQSKLLRVLEEKKLRRIGSISEIDIDIRIIAATHCDLNAMVDKGDFRKDLFYLLNVVTIMLPPLRSRNGDLKLLIEHFVNKYNQVFEKQVKGISVEALNILCGYEFPGNVRELKNLIERAMILCETDIIEVHNLPERLLPKVAINPVDYSNFQISFSEEVGKPLMLYKKEISDNAEKQYILSVLACCGGNVTRAAEKSGILRTNLLRLMNKHNIKSQAFKILNK